MGISDTLRKKYDKLRAEVEKHNRLYHVEANPEITDADYDRLFDELVALEQEHPELRSPDSPTQKVGGEPLAKFEKAEHRLPMLSLEKSYGESDILSWIAQLKREVGDKLDVKGFRDR